MLRDSVAPRDYSMGGSRVSLRLFDDRLELYTPGRLLDPLTPEMQNTGNSGVIPPSPVC